MVLVWPISINTRKLNDCGPPKVVSMTYVCGRLGRTLCGFFFLCITVQKLGLSNKWLLYRRVFTDLSVGWGKNSHARKIFRNGVIMPSNRYFHVQMRSHLFLVEWKISCWVTHTHFHCIWHSKIIHNLAKVSFCCWTGSFLSFKVVWFPEVE